MSTGVFRFDFQIGAVAHSTGIVLNVGANEDPAGLRDRYGSRVINCDLTAFDEGMNRPNVVDAIFDMTQLPWPFNDDYAELVVFGDVLEHHPYDKIVLCMKEAARVARTLCITVPEDHRIPADAVWREGEYNQHVTVVTEDLLRQAMKESGWTPYMFIEAEWGFDNVMGWCVMAHRTVVPD